MPRGWGLCIATCSPSFFPSVVIIIPPDAERPDQALSRFCACPQGCLFLFPAPPPCRIDFRRYAGGICRPLFLTELWKGVGSRLCVALNFPAIAFFPGAIAVYLEDFPRLHPIHSFLQAIPEVSSFVLLKTGRKALWFPPFSIRPS